MNNRLTSVQAINDASVNANQPGSVQVPHQNINWPSSTARTLIEQVKAAGISAKPAAATPTAPALVSPNTQGIPSNLANLTAVKTPISSTQYAVTLSFQRNPGDLYYKSTKIYMRQGQNPPIVVGEGVESPIKITVAKTTAPVTFSAQAIGNWGSVDVKAAPTHTLSLNTTSKIPGQA